MTGSAMRFAASRPAWGARCGRARDCEVRQQAPVLTDQSAVLASAVVAGTAAGGLALARASRGRGAARGPASSGDDESGPEVCPVREEERLEQPVDVDGDGRRDTAYLDWIEDRGAILGVRTASGQTDEIPSMGMGERLWRPMWSPTGARDPIWGSDDLGVGGVGSVFMDGRLHEVPAPDGDAPLTLWDGQRFDMGPERSLPSDARTVTAIAVENSSR